MTSVVLHKACPELKWLLHTEPGVKISKELRSLPSRGVIRLITHGVEGVSCPRRVMGRRKGAKLSYIAVLAL